MKASLALSVAGLFLNSALGSFSSRCTEIDVYRERYTRGTYYLEATCSGFRVRTGLDLNKCLGFDGDKLIAQNNGGFHGKCFSSYLGACTLNGTIFTCGCYTGYSIRTSIDLDPIVNTEFDWLKCFDNMGVLL